MFELKDLQYSFEDLLFDFSFKLNSIDSLAIIGPRDSGKTTLLNLIGGYIESSSGSIVFNNKYITKLPPKKRPVSMIFKQKNYFEALNVFDNVALGISPDLKIDSSEKNKVEEALIKVGLDGFNSRFPRQLPPDLQVAIAIARAIVRNKPILLVENILSGIDIPLQVKILDLLLSLQNDKSLVLLMIIKNITQAMKFNKICFLDQGKILHLDTSKNFENSSKDSIIKEYFLK